MGYAASTVTPVEGSWWRYRDKRMGDCKVQIITVNHIEDNIRYSSYSGDSVRRAVKSKLSRFIRALRPVEQAAPTTLG